MGEGEGLPQLRLERGIPVGTGAPYEKLKPGPGMSPAAVARNQRARIEAAMAEILAEQEYDAITVRDLTRRASVSTRTFYRCFADREECFLSIQERTARRLLLEMAASQVDSGDAETRMRRVIEAFLRASNRDIGAAHLTLIDAQVAGRRAQVEARRMQRSMEMSVGSCFGDLSIGPSARRHIAEGVVAGLIGVTRLRLLPERGEPLLLDLSEGLSGWALAYHDPALAKLEGLHRPPALIDRNLDHSGGGSRNGDVDLLLSALARLVATDDPEALSVRNLLKVAGLPRRAFNDNFASLEDCFVAALDARIEAAMAAGVGAAHRRPTPARGIVAAVDAFCAQTSSDPALASLCFSPLAVDMAAKTHCHERIKARMVDLIDYAVGSPRNSTDPSLSSEASVAACWGVLQNEVTARDCSASSKLAPTLAYLILTPAVGATEAVEAIRNEYGFHENNQGGVVQYHE